MDQNNPQNEQDNHTAAKVAALGAAVIGGVAAAVVLSNKGTQDSIKEGINSAQAHVGEALEKLKAQFADLKAKVEKTLADSDTNQAAISLKESLAEVGENLKTLGSAASEDADTLMAEIQTKMDKLSADYEEMMKK